MKRTHTTYSLTLETTCEDDTKLNATYSKVAEFTVQQLEQIATQFESALQNEFPELGFTVTARGI